MTGPHLIGIIDSYLEALNNNQTTIIETVWQSVERVAMDSCQRAVSMAEDAYKDHMMDPWFKICNNHANAHRLYTYIPNVSERKNTQPDVVDDLHKDVMDTLAAASTHALEKANSVYDANTMGVGSSIIVNSYRNELDVDMETLLADFRGEMCAAMGKNLIKIATDMEDGNSEAEMIFRGLKKTVNKQDATEKL